MIKLFLKLEWLKLSRSSNFNRSVVESLVFLFVTILFLISIVSGGIFLDEIIRKITKTNDTFNFINSVLLFYFLSEFMIRYLLQKLPVFDVESFLHLPISKKTIVNYLLLRSLFNPFNIISISIILPFTLTKVVESHGYFGALSWLLSIILTSVSIHYFTLWFKLRFDDSWKGILIVLSISVLSFWAKDLGLFDVGSMMSPFYISAVNSFVVPFMTLLIVVGAYLYLSGYYIRHINSDQNIDQLVTFTNKPLGVFNRFGLAGELAEVEWRLIVRHKKSRHFLWISLLFLLYGLHFYSKDYYQNPESVKAIMLVPSIFVMGSFMLNYGQMLISWNSADFDFYLIKPQGIAALIKGKFLLFILATIISFVLCIPYIYFGWYILWLHLVSALFNLGVTMHVISLLSLWQPKPMDINKGTMFNYEGTGFAQYLMAIPVFILPILVFSISKSLFNSNVAIWTLGIVGLIGLILFPKMASLTVKKIMSHRYGISENFRNKK